jgi:hypothetical protein
VLVNRPLFRRRQKIPGIIERILDRNTGTLMVTARVAARPRGRVVHYGNAIGWADFTFAAKWAKLREEGNRPPEIPARSCGEDLMNNRRSKSKGER